MNETEQNLLEAWNSTVDCPVELTYRIYYNPATGETTRTDTELFDEPHVVVDRETYNAFNSYMQIVVNGELVNRPKGTSYSRTMQKSDTGEYATMRNRSMFPVDPSTPDADKWQAE
jgi:hypothetical protein